MKWDVFVSHANEDKAFARDLVVALEEAGLRVWFDEQTLFAGDSLRRAINQGLAESRYGIVILSSNFFAKEWPQKELDGLVAREDGKEKVIIPIWHNVDVEDVRTFSPMLADKLSVISSENVGEVVEKILRAIYQDRHATEALSSISHILPDNTELTLLPIKPRNNLVLGIAKHPVTNSQYKDFMRATGHGAPVGETFIDGKWQGPFAPLDQPEFNNPQQPVVCINLADAFAYCRWLNKLLKQESEVGASNRQVYLPLVELWDVAAFGVGFNNKYVKGMVFNEQPNVHHNSNAPAVIDESGVRTNKRGVSDMFGNVWEWCIRELYDAPVIAIVGHTRKAATLELRGGSFLDDLREFKDKPAVPVNMLKEEWETRHSDLGFRIAATVHVDYLTQAEHVKLTLKQRLSNSIWDACEGVARYTVGDYYY